MLEVLHEEGGVLNKSKTSTIILQIVLRGTIFNQIQIKVEEAEL
jgi:hypothetical protein